MYVTVEGLCCILENNITLYIDYASIKNKQVHTKYAGSVWKMNKRVFKWTGKCMDEFFMISYAHSFSNLERGVFIYYILTIMKYVKENDSE